MEVGVEEDHHHHHHHEHPFGQEDSFDQNFDNEKIVVVVVAD